MSNTFHLVCHETKKSIWIGQGGGDMRSIYSGEPKTMRLLKQFLNDHLDKELEFTSSANDRIISYEQYDRR